MSELPVSSAMTKKNAPPLSNSTSGLLLSCLVLLSSCLVSHPVLFSYFFFLSPYLLKLLSFLSPLIVTTFLVILALLTLSPRGLARDGSLGLQESSEFKLGLFLRRACCKVVEKLSSGVTGDQNEASQEFEPSEDLEVYKIFFEASTWDNMQNQHEVSEPDSPKNRGPEEEAEVPVDKFLIYGDGGGNDSANSEAFPHKFEDDSVEVKAEKTLQGLFKEDVECESEGLKVGEKEVKVADSESKKVVEGVEKEDEDDPLSRTGSEALTNKINDTKARDCYFSRARRNSGRLGRSLRLDENAEGLYYYSPNMSDENFEKMGSLGSFGSMRREKEWKRTLACKLFEERHNADGADGDGDGERMDLLWETYDENDCKAKKGKSATPTKKTKKGGARVESHADDVEEEEEEEDMDDQFCCLQALKFSAGKMNLGMGRPNLVKISKAFRGFGWLHHVSKHSKKVV